MKRRTFLLAMGLGGVAFAGYRYWPDEGIWNPCPEAAMPEYLARHELVQAAWEGVDPAQVWDCHVHLGGVGDGASGIWINPDMDSVFHPIQYVQKKFYLNASCADQPGQIDASYLRRLMVLQDGLVQGSRLMLLALDYYYLENGQRAPELSAFYTPNTYAGRIAERYPDRFEWIASIHPYREDGIDALESAVKAGARAVKWLPPAMGMDPASPKCDPFYAALVRLDVPLLTHAGGELAVHGSAAQTLGNPLRLRRPLEHGVRVIVAHCASLGANPDIDKGAHGPKVKNFDLFARLMDEARYHGRLYGEISAMPQINRMGRALETVIRRTEWHSRVINGSDYPLPGVMPLFSLKRMVEKRYITVGEAAIMSEIRRYNPLLFDFLLKRHLKVKGNRFATEVFESRRLFDRAHSLY